MKKFIAVLLTGFCVTSLDVQAASAAEDSELLRSLSSVPGTATASASTVTVAAAVADAGVERQRLNILMLPTEQADFRISYAPPILKVLPADAVGMLSRYLAPADQASFRATSKSAKKSAPYDFRGEVTVSYKNYKELRETYGSDPFKHTTRLIVSKRRKFLTMGGPDILVPHVVENFVDFDFDFRGILNLNDCREIRRTPTHVFREVPRELILKRTNFETMRDTLKTRFKPLVFEPLVLKPLVLEPLVLEHT